MVEFQKAMKAAGLTPPAKIIGDGKVHRFKDGDEKKESGWYVFFTEDMAGVFGCWKTGLNEKWTSKKKYTPEERRAFAVKMEKEEKERAKAKRERLEACRETSAKIWDQASREEDHPYITRKGIKSYGVRFSMDSVVIPLRDTNGTLHGLQYIRQDGTKRFQPGTAKKGCYMSIGKLNGTLCICEGYATGASIHEATGYPVAVAFDAGNLIEVAKVLRARFKDMVIIICADHDEVGIEKAAKAAAESRCQVVYPDFEGMDFNDAHQKYGPENLRNIIGCQAGS